MNQQNEIAVVEQDDVLEAAIQAKGTMHLFTEAGALAPLLEAIREAALANYKPDLSTVKGRKEIASVAAKVAKAKVRLDSIGKELVAELKELPKRIDGNRKMAREYLEDLQEAVRAPLTAWEAREAEEAAAAQALAERIQAEREIEDAHELAILLNEKFDRERADRLKREAEEREEHERQVEILAAMRAEANAKAAIEAAERAAQEAEARAKRAEDEAAERAVRAAETARLEEQRRQADEAAKAKAEQDAITAGNIARTQDAEHRKAVNREALADLMKLGLTEEQGKAVIVGIAQGKVSYVRIAY